MKSKLASSFACIAVLAFSVTAHAANTLAADAALLKNQELTSKNGFYHLRMQDDGNLVLSFGLSGHPWIARWSTGTRKEGEYALMQWDGNFVVYTGSREAVWASNTVQSTSDAAYKLTLGEDGKLALRLGSNVITLSEHTCPRDGGPAFAYPMHRFESGQCTNGFTEPKQCGVAANEYAWKNGYQLGSCADNIGSDAY